MTGNQGTVVTNIAKVVNGGITAITASASQAATLIGSAAKLGSAALTVNTAVTDSTEAGNLITNIAKVASAGLEEITLTQTQFNTIVDGSNTAKLKDDAVTIGAVTATGSGGAETNVLAQGAKIANNGITAITITDAEFNTFIGANSADPFASASVTLGNVTGNESTVLTNIAKVAANGITALTFSADSNLQANSSAIGTAAFAANSITVTNGAITSAQTTVVYNI